MRYQKVAECYTIVVGSLWWLIVGT